MKVPCQDLPSINHPLSPLGPCKIFILIQVTSTRDFTALGMKCHRGAITILSRLWQEKHLWINIHHKYVPDSIQWDREGKGRDRGKDMGTCWEGGAQEEFLETYLYAEQTYDIINILSHVYILSMILSRNNRWHVLTYYIERRLWFGWNSVYLGS